MCFAVLRSGGVALTSDDNSLLVWTVNSNHDLVIFRSLRKQELALSSYPTLSGNHGGLKLYSMIKRNFFWSSIDVDFYSKVRNCAEGWKPH